MVHQIDYVVHRITYVVHQIDYVVHYYVVYQITCVLTYSTFVTLITYPN